MEKAPCSMFHALSSPSTRKSGSFSGCSKCLNWHLGRPRTTSVPQPRPLFSTKDPSNLPSTAWVYRFFQHHSELTLRTPMLVGKERALMTPPKCRKMVRTLKAYVDAQDPLLLSDPSRIFNADESGFSFDPKSRKVITWKGAKTIYNMTSNTKTQVTVLASMSAAGLYLPPLLIYPYKRIPGKNLLEGFPETLLQVSDNGWITSPIFFTWLRDSFIPATHHLQKPILLLVDDHVSHKSLLETSQICEENNINIILFCFLPHASYVMQPLDQAFFGSIKAAWSAASRRHIAETGEAVGLDTFAKVFHGVWHSSATQANAESSYRAAGIYPFSPERVLQTKKLKPCQVFRDFVSTEPALPLPVEQETPSTSTEVENVPPLASSHHPQKSDEEPMPPSPFDYNDDNDPMSPCPSVLPPLESFMEFSPAQEIQNLPPMSTPRQEEPSTILPTPSPAPTERVAPEPQPLQIPIPFQSPSQSKSPFQSPSPSKSLFQSPIPTKSPPLSQPTQIQSPVLSTSQILSPTSLSIPTTSTTSIVSPPHKESDYSAKQLEAMKDFALFVVDDLARNGFLRCHQALTRDGTESHKGFEKFKMLAANLKSSFKSEKVASHSKAPLTIDDILRIPKFSGKGKQKARKTAPTMQYVARQEKATEMERKRKEKRDQALLKKLEREALKKRKHSDSEEDEIVERDGTDHERST